MPPTLGVVVDHSGAVGSNDEVLSGVNSMAVVFDSNNFEATAYVAANGEVVPMEPSKVPKTEPFGDAPLEQAMTTAFGQNLKAREKSGLTGTKTGVFTIVNGNRFGGVDSVIATAKAQETPVFIANVEGEADPVVVDEFKRIAKETGGVYFDVQSDNTEEMSNKIQDTLDKNQLKRDQPNRWPLKVMAGLLGVGTFAAGYRNRRKEPTYKRVEL
jgi:hypothetical protein